MSNSIDDLIARADGLSRAKDRNGAMALANELVSQYPNEMKVWSLRAHLHALNHHYSEAVADLTRAIEINNMEPDFFFNRGSYSFRLGDNQSAIDDFTKGLALCDYHKDDYYRETLYFWRAETLLRLGRKQEAVADLSHIREDFSFWTDRLRTKADLLAECNKYPNGKS